MHVLSIPHRHAHLFRHRNCRPPRSASLGDPETQGARLLCRRCCCRVPLAPSDRPLPLLKRTQATLATLRLLSHTRHRHRPATAAATATTTSVSAARPRGCALRRHPRPVFHLSPHLRHAHKHRAQVLAMLRDSLP